MLRSDPVAMLSLRALPLAGVPRCPGAGAHPMLVLSRLAWNAADRGLRAGRRQGEQRPEQQANEVAGV